MARRGRHRPITAGTIKHAVRQAELADRTAGQRGTGATGYTLLRLRGSPIARLVDAGRIGPEELQAAHDITTAFHALAGHLMLRPHRMERTDPSRDSTEPVAVIDAQLRYRAWADHWSLMRKKFGDRTMEIVIAAVIDDRQMAAIDADIGIREGTAVKATVRGLRDYASRAGWAGKLANQWLADAGVTFPRRRI